LYSLLQIYTTLKEQLLKKAKAMNTNKFTIKSQEAFQQAQQIAQLNLSHNVYILCVN
jgi:hypothetical protein